MPRGSHLTDGYAIVSYGLYAGRLTAIMIFQHPYEGFSHSSHWRLSGEEPRGLRMRLMKPDASKVYVPDFPDGRHKWQVSATAA
jgi:hypothetical protein